MGQRLVVTVKSTGEDLCKMYFHWSAYTISALMEVRDMMAEFPMETNSKEDAILYFIRYCEEYGGGIDGGMDSKEWNYITNKYPNYKFKSENINRNRGLIAISEDGMDEMQSWSEGDIYINLDEMTVHNELFLYYDDIDEYNRELADREDESITLDEIPEVGEIGDFDLEDIDDVIANLEDIPGYVCRNGNEIYELIA
jgi:hypothetical protein